MSYERKLQIVGLVLIVLFALLLYGCTTWSQPGKTEADYQRDHYECARDVAAVRDSVYALHLRMARMRTKGWIEK